MIPKPGKTLELLLQGLIQWGERVELVLQQTSSKDIADDLVTYLALSRAVEVVGEIASELMRLYPDWAEPRRTRGLLGANRMRNRLAHAYDDIDPVLLLGIAAEDVSVLTENARDWLDELRLSA